jgi:hypothetical protein
MYCVLSVSNKEFLDFILTNKLGFKEKLIFVHQRNIVLFDWLNIKKEGISLIQKSIKSEYFYVFVRKESENIYNMGSKALNYLF